MGSQAVVFHYAAYVANGVAHAWFYVEAHIHLFSFDTVMLRHACLHVAGIVEHTGDVVHCSACLRTVIEHRRLS